MDILYKKMLDSVIRILVTGVLHVNHNQNLVSPRSRALMLLSVDIRRVVTKYSFNDFAHVTLLYEEGQNMKAN